MKKQADVFAKTQQLKRKPSHFCIWVAELNYKELV